MLSYEEGTFRTFDDLKLFYRIYSEPKTTDWLLILHGQGEHSGRYQKFASRLEGENLSIAVFDHRGHGRSEGKDVYLESFQDYLKDVSAFTIFLKNRSQTDPNVFLFGNSLGGLTAVHWACQFPGQLSALILSSPCLGLRQPQWIFYFNHLFNFFYPEFLYRNPIYPPFLTHDPKEVEKYKKDDLVKRRITVRLLDEMVNATRFLETGERYDFPFPVYILTAGDERIVDPLKTKLFFDKIHCPKKELKIFPNFYHEIFNETSQDEAFKTLKACLRASRSL